MQKHPKKQCNVLRAVRVSVWLPECGPGWVERAHEESCGRAWTLLLRAEALAHHTYILAVP